MRALLLIPAFALCSCAAGGPTDDASPCTSSPEAASFCFTTPMAEGLAVRRVQGPDFDLYDVERGEAYLMRVYDGSAANAPMEKDTAPAMVAGERIQRSTWQTEATDHVLLDRGEDAIPYSQLHFMIPRDLNPDDAEFADELVESIAYLR